MSQSGVSSPAAEKRGGTSHPSGPGDGDGSGCRSLGTEQATRSAQTKAHLRQRAKDPNRRKGTATLETFMNLCRTRRDIPAAAAFAEGGHVLSSLLECEHSFPITVVGSFASGIDVMDETHENALLAQDLSIATSGDLRLNYRTRRSGRGLNLYG